MNIHEGKGELDDFYHVLDLGCPSFLTSVISS